MFILNHAHMKKAVGPLTRDDSATRRHTVRKGSDMNGKHILPIRNVTNSTS